jgi:hypothetical protein
MMKFGLIGAAAVSLLLAGPAMAGSSSDGVHRGHQHRYNRVIHHMPAQDFDHFDYGIARPTYHSGWAGPYGDGLYPGSVDQNMRSY